MKRVKNQRMLCGLAALLGVLLASCERGAGPAKPANDTQELALLTLSEARALQRRADLLLSDGDVQGAIASVTEVLGLPFPEGMAEADEVKLDARGRLARLHLSQGTAQGVEQALTVIAAGRAASKQDSFFLSQLELLQGEALEAKASHASDEATRREAKQEAVSAYDRAIAIDKRLIRVLLNLPPMNENRAAPTDAASPPGGPSPIRPGGRP